MSFLILLTVCVVVCFTDEKPEVKNGTQESKSKVNFIVICYFSKDGFFSTYGQFYS